MSKIDNKVLPNYSQLCTEYYELDKPHPPQDALNYYLKHAKDANGPISEPMSGSGRFQIPLLLKGYDVIGFDNSPSMIETCKQKCTKLCIKYENKVFLASFADFIPTSNYKLIFIPSGSFCLLTEKAEIEQALSFCTKYLDKNGKFIFEVDTVACKNKNPGAWQQNSVNKADGSKIILNSFAQFDEGSKIESTICRYQLWQDGEIIKEETENFKIKLYENNEIEKLLEPYNLSIIGKYQPYTNKIPNDQTETIVYECVNQEYVLVSL